MKPPRQAYEDTRVSAEQSKAEIRAFLLRYGAEQFGIIEEQGHALLGFVAQGRLVRIEVKLPDRRQPAYTASATLLPAGSPRALSAHAQEERRLWRAVRHWVKAQLAAVESGIRTFAEVWLADTVLPSGESFSQWAEPQIQESITQGRMPALLSGRALAGHEREGS
jgi:hypothetical protein